MKPKLPLLKIGVLILTLFIVFDCKIAVNHSFRNVYDDYNSSVHNSDEFPGFLKVHYKNGNVCVFNSWSLTPNGDTIAGQGKLFDLQRKEIEDGKLNVAIDQIAIIETNQLDQIKDKTNSRVARLSILTGADALLGFLCLTNPKACFGSCPTFYINGFENVHSSNAEGFSSSISPALEKNDIDALNFRTPANHFKLTMKNEALETHAVNEIKLIAAEVETGKSVYHSFNDKFYQSNFEVECSRAQVNDKTITQMVRDIDDSEYFSLADSTDLSEKEEIYLDFHPHKMQLPGLVLNFRQTLLTTFLLYNGISYMGDEVGDYFSKIETNGLIRKKLANPFKKLGGIKVYYFDNSKENWVFVNEIYETGPIAKNLQLVVLDKLKNSGNNIRVKLEMTRGMWRIDYASLVNIENEIEPVFVSPSEINTNSLPDDAARKGIECDDENYLISFPGDNFDLYFNLPQLEKANSGYELFLSTKGYYLEWMREEWLAGKNTAKLEKMLLNDKETWKSLAQEYKIYEDQMEKVFWSSKYENVQ